MTETRRSALKMLGAISATCASPFAGDELYGQHHPSSPSQALPTSAGPSAPYTPTFFTSAEYLALARLVDVIIPPTDTPGGMGAGVHAYIDRVVSGNAEHQSLARTGLGWLERGARAAGATSVATLDEAAAIALLQPTSDAVDRENDEGRRARFRADDTGRLIYFVPTTDRDAPQRGPAARQPPAELGVDDPTLPARFFRLMKSLTADGYYTSRIGLLDELRYAGNTAMLECLTRIGAVRMPHRRPCLRWSHGRRHLRTDRPRGPDTAVNAPAVGAARHGRAVHAPARQGAVGPLPVRTRSGGRHAAARDDGRGTASASLLAPTLANGMAPPGDAWCGVSQLRRGHRAAPGHGLD